VLGAGLSVSLYFRAALQIRGQGLIMLHWVVSEVVLDAFTTCFVSPALLIFCAACSTAVRRPKALDEIVWHTQEAHETVRTKRHSHGRFIPGIITVGRRYIVITILRNCATMSRRSLEIAHGMKTRRRSSRRRKELPVSIIVLRSLCESLIDHCKNIVRDGHHAIILADDSLVGSLPGFAQNK